MRAWALVVLAGCGAADEPCGPAQARVARVIDGDTVELDSGETVRYLLVDTPESTTSHECFGAESSALNASLVAGRQITLRYDAQVCRDRYDRLLAYVSLDGREVNALLVERGHACVLYVPPAGEERRAGYQALETQARQEGRGLWGACARERPCR